MFYVVPKDSLWLRNHQLYLLYDCPSTGLILPPEERSEHEAELLAVPAPPAAAVVARLSREQYASRA